MVTQTPSNGAPPAKPVVIAPEPVIPPSPPGPFEPVKTAIPAFFYLDGETPTMKDRGRTGFMVANMAEAGDLAIVSEDLGDHPIVYFYGIEDVSRVEIHFDQSAGFPSCFVIRQGEGPDVVGTLSPYDGETETFSLTVNEGFETYDGLVLNASLFDAYPDKGDLNDSQYLRVKNIITSLALWTAIAYQTQEADPAVAGESVGEAAVASAVEAVACPPAMLVMTSAAAVIPLMVTPVQVVAASVAAALAAGMPESLPPEGALVTAGDTGPAGGILAFRLEEADGSYSWLEAAPNDIGPARMRNGEAVNMCDAYSVTAGGTKITGWLLPNYGELGLVYDLYKKGKIECQPEIYWSSKQAKSVNGSTYYISVDF
ncbi:MAG: hypothetical protein LBI94_06605, partial [Treponema sp.]|nr:hypothetical protein [Treponema sp.]